MIIDVPATDVVKIYRTLVEVVTPRPIAWVTTIDAEGHINLAPFSFFNAFGANPPVVVFSPASAVTVPRRTPCSISRSCPSLSSTRPWKTWPS